MKTLIIAFASVSIFTACKSGSADPANNIVGTDTTGLYKNNIMADTALIVTAPLPGSVSKRVVETRSPDGSVTTTTTTISTGKDGIAAKTPQKNNAVVTNSGIKNSGSNSQTAASSTVKKKGWSNRAKGAAIGGVGGAVVGAVVSKKKGKGAIIGGAVGAAGGYIIGNEKDKKTNE